jgi:hypothetical protein
VLAGTRNFTSIQGSGNTANKVKQSQQTDRYSSTVRPIIISITKYKSTIVLANLIISKRHHTRFCETKPSSNLFFNELQI